MIDLLLEIQLNVLVGSEKLDNVSKRLAIRPNLIAWFLSRKKNFSAVICCHYDIAHRLGRQQKLIMRRLRDTAMVKMPDK